MHLPNTWASIEARIANLYRLARNLSEEIASVQAQFQIVNTAELTKKIPKSLALLVPQLNTKKKQINPVAGWPFPPSLKSSLGQGSFAQVPDHVNKLTDVRMDAPTTRNLPMPQRAFPQKMFVNIRQNQFGHRVGLFKVYETGCWNGHVDLKLKHCTIGLSPKHLNSWLDFRVGGTESKHEVPISSLF